ncbi:MAG: autotransporter outer membrane beta-barrel domain-containing protein [Cardiobacterium hominis]
MHDNQLGIGISHGITSDLTLGITASVGREKTNGSHDSRLKGNSHYIGAHAVKTLGDLSLTGGLAYSQTNLKGTRHINNGYDAQSHAARNKPSVTSAYAEGKYTLHVNDHLAWEPKAILAYNHLKTSSVNESGSGGLTIASRGINTVDIGIGQDLTYSTKAGSGELRGKLSLDYIHTSGEKDLQARFNGSDSGFTLRTDKNPNTVRTGLTGEYQTAKGVIIRAGVSNNLRKGKNDLQGPQRRGKILSLGTKPTSPAQRGRVGRANKTHRDRINLSPHQQPETSMKKTKILYLAALLGGCAANSGINQNTLARELISPLVKQQCHSQLNARQEWQLASALMGAEIKQQWENKICGCVSEEAPSQMSGEEMIQVINPATRSQAVTNVAVKTVSACFNRIMSR